jgi:hypothetical protein
VTVETAAFHSPAPPLRTTARATSDPDSKQLEQPSTPPRREVLNAMRALRGMPPFAREREIDLGRYSQFSPAERELLKSLDFDH